MNIFELNTATHALNTEYDSLNAQWWDMPSCLSAEANAINARLLAIDEELAELDLQRKALHRTLAEARA